MSAWPRVGIAGSVDSGCGHLCAVSFLLLLALPVLLRVLLRRLLAGQRRKREEQTVLIGEAGGSEPAGCSRTVLYNAHKPTVEAVKRLMQRRSLSAAAVAVADVVPASSYRSMGRPLPPPCPFVR